MLFETEATRISATTVNCPLPMHAGLKERQIIQIQVLIDDEYRIQETLNFLVYPVPVTERIWPNTGHQAGETSVILSGVHFNANFGGISCKFGDLIVKAKVIENERSIQCTTPEQPDSGKVAVALSLNNEEDFHVQGEF
jgi:hypothetical protein